MTADIPLTKIVVPLDGSESSLRAAKYAVKLAKISDAEIFFVHSVLNPTYLEDPSAGILVKGYIDEASRHAKAWFTDVGGIAAQNGVKHNSEAIFGVASASDSIVNYAESKKADLIVIGTKGRTGIKRILLGSVAHGVVNHANCPVLVVR